MNASNDFAKRKLTELLTNTRRTRLLKGVVIVNAGGTISMEEGAVRSPSADLYENLQSRVKHLHPSRFDTLYLPLFERPPDSSTIGSREWLLILSVLRSLLLAKADAQQFFRERGIKLEQGGIVITHGTDTLSLTALALSLGLAEELLQVPVILTGSHLPPDAEGTDAYTNLLRAIYCAQERFHESQQSLPPAVYVLIGSDIHLGSRITKTRTTPDEESRYVFSFPAPLAQVGGPSRFRLTFDRDYLRRLRGHEEELLGVNEPEGALGCVEHLVFDCFADPLCLHDYKRRANYYRAQREEPQLGIVLQGDFSQHAAWATVRNHIDSLCSMHIFVYLGSKRAWQRLAESIDNPYLGLIERSLSHTKAQTKLRWVLQKQRTPSEVNRLMAGNLAGEIVREERLPEWIKYENFPDQELGTEVLIAYPDIDARVAEDATKRLLASESSRPRLFIYGFGDGHVPGPPESPSELVRDYLLSENLTESAVHIPSPELGELADFVCKILRAMDQGRLRDYLADRYQVRPESLRRRIRAEQQKRKQLEMVQRFDKYIKSLVQQFEKQYDGDVKIRRTGETGAALRSRIRLHIPKAAINRDLVDHDLEDSSSWISTLTDEFPRLIALRIVRDAIASRSRLLHVLGTAQDQGLTIRVKSLAVLSPTDTRLYEAGSLLRAVGVDSDRCRGWRTDYLRPKSRKHMS